jgi:photosystem II stability/assembly factor-like uncharacterized protein
VRDSVYICSVFGKELKSHLRLILGSAEPGMILLSDDTGRTFRESHTPIGVRKGELPQIVTGTTPSELFACMAMSNDTGSGLFRSTDGGESWKPLNAPLNIWSILPDRERPGKLWAGQYAMFDRRFPSSGILETEDYGKHWKAFGKTTSVLNWYLRYTPDHRSIVLACEDGLFVSNLRGRSPPPGSIMH